MAKSKVQSSLLLSAVPVRNPLVRTKTRSPVQTRLTAPLQPGLLRRFLAVSVAEKSFDLDALGTAVWDACDGHSTVEQIILDFARARRLNTREAQVAVSTFLRTLLRRNLIALASSPSMKGSA